MGTLGYKPKFTLRPLRKFSLFSGVKYVGMFAFTGFLIFAALFSGNFLGKKKQTSEESKASAITRQICVDVNDISTCYTAECNANTDCPMKLTESYTCNSDGIRERTATRTNYLCNYEIGKCEGSGTSVEESRCNSGYFCNDGNCVSEDKIKCSSSLPCPVDRKVVKGECDSQGNHIKIELIRKYQCDTTSGFCKYSDTESSRSNRTCDDGKSCIAGDCREIGPVSGLKYTCGDSAADATFEWDNMEDAEAYLLKIRKNAGDSEALGVGVQTQIVKENKAYVTGIVAGQVYSSWSVQPLISDKNDPSNFELTKNLATDAGSFICQTLGGGDSSTGGAIVINPYSDITKDSAITISGVKPAGSGIYVDGNLALSNTGDSTWTLTIPLPEYGINSFSLQLDPNGMMFPLRVTRCKEGDIDCDGKINVSDFTLFIKAVQIQIALDRGDNVQADYPFMKLADMNNDSKVDVIDFSIFKTAYLSKE